MIFNHPFIHIFLILLQSFKESSQKVIALVFHDLDSLRVAKRQTFYSSVVGSLRLLLEPETAISDIWTDLFSSYDIDGVFGTGDQDFCDVILKTL